MTTAWTVPLFIALNGLDAGLTLALVHRGAVEGNPVQALVLGAGWAVFFVGKLALAAIAGVVVDHYRPAAMRLLCWAFGAIVAWNALCLVVFTVR